MTKAGVYAYSTKGVWTVAILINGTLEIFSSYQYGKNYRFNLFKPEPPMPWYPKYLNRLIAEAWDLINSKDGE